jgi:hypothetical protein
MTLKMTTEEFIQKARLIHGDKYEYSQVDYQRSTIKTVITCPKHGDFLQKPNSHLNGDGCPRCASNSTGNTEDFIEKATAIHGDKYLYNNVIYRTSKTYISVTCFIHGEFNTTPNRLLKGCGCPKCSKYGFQSNTAEFVKKATEIHEGKYTYESTVYIQALKKVIISCDRHGDFSQKPSAHLNGQGCPGCRSSKGEILVERYLKSKNILFVRQRMFEDCKNKRSLRFDFWLPDFNMCVEYHGEQHFYPVKWPRRMTDEEAMTAFEYRQKNDQIKRDYCKMNGIHLIEIPFTADITDFLNNIDYAVYVPELVNV